MRIDQIMIKEMLNEYQLGIYSVSVRYIEIFHFIPKIIMISILPVILTSRNYYVKLLGINSVMKMISLILIIFIFLSSDIVIPLIFSDTYIESINITKILSFSIFFCFPWSCERTLVCYKKFGVVLCSLCKF